jgi:hypothetical protein
MAIWLAEERGYKAGWAKNLYNDKFGVWPRNLHAKPVPADAAVRSYAKGRLIAFAKERKVEVA